MEHFQDAFAKIGVLIQTCKLAKSDDGPDLSIADEYDVKAKMKSAL